MPDWALPFLEAVGRLFGEIAACMQQLGGLRHVEPGLIEDMEIATNHLHNLAYSLRREHDKDVD